jgi:hydroxymethylpyrimidine pyrophosphatase-like HAD family hydrolase
MPRADDVVHSAVLFVDGLDAGELQHRLAPVLPDEVEVTPSGLPGSVELTAPGVHKGSGLAWLCGRLDVDRADVVAFGDGLNDHEMLLWAGWGVAMGNAARITQELADEVTASNDDDGVAVVIERLLDGATI